MREISALWTFEELAHIRKVSLNYLFSVEPAEGSFGVVVCDLDPTRMSDSQLGQLLTLLYSQRFVVLKTSGLEKRDYVAFAKRMGTAIPLSHDVHFPEIAEISNLKVNTKKKRLGAAHWHTDQSFRSTVSSVTMLHSRACPEVGGETKFCDMASAYNALSQEMKTKIEDLIVVHRHGVSIVARPGDQTITAFHPLVRKHPVSKQKTLYAITGTSQGIIAMDPTKAKELLESLCEHTFTDPFVTSYKHEVGDIVMWDNPTTMHSASAIDEATCAADTRIMLRISLKGAPSIYKDIYDENLPDQRQFATA